MPGQLSLRVLLAVAAVTVVAACGEDALPPPPTAAPATSLPAVACPAQSPGTTSDNFHEYVSLTAAAGGLQTGDITVGTGAVVANGDSLTVQYTGWLPNGTVFDSSRSAGRQPFTFVIGTGHVIAGWDQGLIGMRVGGKRRLVIPPSLGYGARATGCIPANSTLLFDVEVLSATPPSPAAAAPASPSPSPT
ncbi:MAG: FKBP-type peptidyl-prolyl cis-trans isomerase [Candidatus Dormibacteria bacterium]